MRSFVSLLVSLWSASVCADVGVVTKVSCDLIYDNSNKKSLYIDNYKIDLEVDDLTVKLVNVYSGSLNVILLSSDNKTVFISVSPKSKDLLVEARRQAIKSPLGDLLDFSELYGSSPFGMGKNAVYEGGFYGPFLFVETGADTRSTKIIGNSLLDKHVAKVSISPALSCNQVSIADAKSFSEIDKNSAIFKLKDMIDVFMNSGKIENEDSLIGVEL